MIAVDTNVLLRLFLEDSPGETDIAEALLAGRSARNPVYIATPVLLEIVWVLETKGHRRAGVAEVLQNICALDNTIIADREQVTQAVDAYASGKADFADYLILAGSRTAGAAWLASFDKALCQEQKYCRQPKSLL
jgi:predicted nucleic-acid-binding protein